jgi:hypothetical protein
MSKNLFLAIITLCYTYSLTTSCPRYQCFEGQDQNCVSLTSGISTIGYNSVNLSDICQTGEICNVKPPLPPYVYLESLEHDANFTCKQNNSTTKIP